MVNNKRPTNNLNVILSLLTTWNQFKTQYLKALYNTALPGGGSQGLAEACIEIATSYTNSIVEQFKKS
jgi:hypothetical protein